MKIRIHKKYESLTKEIEDIPNIKYKVLQTFCKQRNVVELVEIAGKMFVVKKYKVPNPFNRVVYTFFRKSKAQRAYDNALKIMRCGVSTPFPVAYIETKKGGLFHTGYFVSEYMDLPTLSKLKNISIAPEELELFKMDFTNFTISLHEKGILPLDYNTGNIFYYKDEKNGHYKFALTDINRAKFGEISKYKDTMYSLEQLGIPPGQLYGAVFEYAKRRELDIEASLFLVFFYRVKRRIKKLFKTKLRLLKGKKC